MADTKITALTAITTVDPAVDVLPIVDVSDTTMAASGTTKKITSNQILGAGGTATLASATITGDLTVATNGLKVDSANKNVGINTATPTNTAGYKTLEIVGTGVNTGGMLRFKSSDTSVNTLDFADSNGRAIFAISNHPVRFGCNDIEQYRINPLGVFTWYDGAGGTRMTLNANGLGIGVTPSAWNTLTPVQVKNAAFSGYLNNAYVTSNAYYDSTFKYIAGSSRAALYNQASGVHAWYYDSGTQVADTNCNFTQAMTLDASGNLLIGTTSAIGSKLGYQAQGGNGVAYLLRHTSSTAGKYRIFAVDSTNNGLFYDQNNVGMYMADGGTSWVATSDETQKDIIEPISNAISKVGSLRAVIGKFKTDANSVRRSFLIAQDVQTALPEAVHQKDGLLGLSYTDVIPLLVAAIKELTAEVNALKNA